MLRLFDFLKTNSNGTDTNDEVSPIPAVRPLPDDTIFEDNEELDEIEFKRPLPEIPEELFIEKNPPKKEIVMNQEPDQTTTNDISSLYRHLEQNLEKKGYEDALMNPDSSNMEESLEVIKNDLFIVISKVKTYYQDAKRTIDFHIESRGRSGMIDTVDELLSNKQSIDDKLKVVAEIEEDAKRGEGLSKSLFISYKKGFRNGLATISFGTALKK